MAGGGCHAESLTLEKAESSVLGSVANGVVSGGKTTWFCEL